MKDAIQIRGVDEFKVVISDQLQLAKQEALEASAMIKSVTSDITLQAAADAMVSIKRVLKVTETSRKDAKAPVLAWGKAIDAPAAEFIEELEINESRIGFLIAPYEEGKRKAAAELEAKRLAEIRRIEEENQKIQEEIAKKIREVQSAAAKSANEADKKRADELAAKMKAEADKKQEAYEENLRRKPIEATKTEGLIGKEVTKFKVVDILALSRSHPQLVRMEVNTSAMNAYLASGLPVPTSVNVWKEFDVNARI